MADGDPSEPRMTLQGVPVQRVAGPRPASQPSRPPSQPASGPTPVPNPAVDVGSQPAAVPNPAVPNPAVSHPSDPAWVRGPDPTPSPSPEPSGRMTAPMPQTAAPLPQQQPVAAAPSQQAMPPYAPGPIPPQPDGTVGDGPIRVVCRRCQRAVWGWKLPFGVSCPIGPHHSHVNWFLVGVVASFWAVFFVVIISLIGIAAS